MRVSRRAVFRLHDVVDDVGTYDGALCKGAVKVPGANDEVLKMAA